MIVEKVFKMENMTYSDFRSHLAATLDKVNAKRLKQAIDQLENKNGISAYGKTSE